MEASFKTESVIGAGRGALVSGMFGAGWLGWGLGEAKSFTGPVGLVLGLAVLAILACSIYAIRRGRLLRNQHGHVPAATRKAGQKAFLRVVLWEVLACGVVAILAWRLNRPDLGCDWVALVVGLHYLPLAKVFRAPALIVIGILVTL